MMKAAVVNCSAPHYNLGAAKLSDWLREEGWQVDTWGGDPGMFVANYDLVCLSVIFSWHAPLAAAIAQRARAQADVWCGGPGMTALRHWWSRETGLPVVIGLDSRFDRQRGDYRMTFASRGCPVGCWFCIVPKLEGRTFTLDWDFVPAPILCDNNLSALSADFQEHIVRRYQQARMPLKDANSGFEPATFDADTYHRWKPILRGPWRFAFDETRERLEVERVARLLAGEARSRKRVYVLIGNEPMEACYERVREVIAWGCDPHCQPVLPLNYLGGPLRARHDWTEQRLKDFTRWVNRHLWRYMPLADYARRKNEPPPFGAFRWAERRAA